MKKSVVAIYTSHDTAVEAVRHLVKNGIPENELSIVGQGEVVEDHIHFVPIKQAKMVTPYVGIGIGALLGLLSGFVEIPGISELFDGNGALAMIGGVVFGAVIGALVSIIFSMIFRKDDLVVMQKHLDRGKFMLIVKGSLEDIEKSKKLLHTENVHEEIMDIEG